MSSSNCCFLTCIQVSQEADKVVWYFHLFKNLPQFVVIHTVKGFGVVNKAGKHGRNVLGSHLRRGLSGGLQEEKRVPERPWLWGGRAERLSAKKKGWSLVGWRAQITNNQGDLLRQKMPVGKSLRSMKEPLNSPQISLHMLPGGHHWEALKEDIGSPHTSTCQARWPIERSC